MQLLEMERRLDVVLERKRIELQDAVRKPPKAWRYEMSALLSSCRILITHPFLLFSTRSRLRLFLSFCTIRDGGAAGAPEEPPTRTAPIRWGLRIEGRLLDDEVLCVVKLDLHFSRLFYLFPPLAIFTASQPQAPHHILPAAAGLDRQRHHY